MTSSDIEEKCHVLRDSKEKVNRIREELSLAVKEYNSCHVDLMKSLGEQGLSLDNNQVWPFVQVLLGAVGVSVPDALRIDFTDMMKKKDDI